MKRRFFAALLVLALTLALAGCGRSSFGLSENSEKRMVITAERAAKDAFFMVGSLEVEEGERIAIRAALTKGEIEVEIVAAPAAQSIDGLPDFDGEAVLTAKLKNSDGAAGTVSAGSYLLRATCLERASGTVVIEVEPAA